ncbi:unnamed protein product [Didymodactylos carnosus]|uniref:Interleukin enhancer binding factor n=1 Tax=Didymodactylos carnosus TaxID=1234261 RepID=A0A813SRE5_9BILA|nr:unnamed protein product [Didymodactylos carnosus]CAF0801158.1 unnamed protein product [Didymodactylos carnosus]CAF3528250.1 unnamed protein product [Didymodactylos carnosus]CAF3586338.1 unnamed protein product [Didymodactylos carnosus]
MFGRGGMYTPRMQSPFPMHNQMQQPFTQQTMQRPILYNPNVPVGQSQSSEACMSQTQQPQTALTPSTTMMIASTPGVVPPTKAENSVHSSESPVKQGTNSEKSVLQLLNELAKYNKLTAKYDLINEQGPAHAKQFEVRLTLGTETYVGLGTSIKRSQQAAAEQALANTKLKKHEAQTQNNQQVQSSQRGRHQGRGRGGHGNQHGRQQQQPQMYPLMRQSFGGGGANMMNFTPQQQQQQQQRLPSHITMGSSFHYHRQDSNLYDRKYDDFHSLKRHLTAKHDDIIESDMTIAAIHKLVEDIERALKLTSDKMMEDSKAKNEKVTPRLPEHVNLTCEEQTEDPTEAFRMLKGAMKVGVLAMRVFLKRDREYSLVLICANKPTIDLLTKISQELTSTLKMLTSDKEEVLYDIQASMDDACIYIKCNLLPTHRIRIMLTSPVLRDENFVNLSDEGRIEINKLNPDPVDMLNKVKCLEAAAEIRHSNWFTGCMLQKRTDLIILRVLRYMQFECKQLAHLNLWCLALLVEKSYKRHSSNVQTYSPPAHVLFRNIFECLSGGVLLPNVGPGLFDPCEKDPVDAAAYLTPEQRNELTTYAQFVLRQLAFQQAHKVLNIDYIPPTSTATGNRENIVPTTAITDLSAVSVMAANDVQETPIPMESTTEFAPISPA